MSDTEKIAELENQLMIKELELRQERTTTQLLSELINRMVNIGLMAGIVPKQLPLQISRAKTPTFWDIIQQLYQEDTMKHGMDFKFSEVTSLEVHNDDTGTTVINFDNKKVVLFIRLTKLYDAYIKVSAGEYGLIPISKSAYLESIKMLPNYLGWIKGKRFDDAVTTCYAFEYEPLNINLTQKSL